MYKKRSNDLPPCYVVVGGLGKSMVFTSIVKKLKEKHDKKIRVYTPYKFVFGNNPNVEMVLGSNEIGPKNGLLLECDIIYREPYFGNFRKNTHHIIEAMCEDYDIEYSTSMKPEFYTSSFPMYGEIIDQIEQLHNKKYIIVQLTGGQTSLAGDNNGDFNIPYNNIDWSRNVDPVCGQKIINALKEEFPNYEIINFSLPNEPNYDGSIKLSLPYMAYDELLKNAEFWVGIDSCLNHLSAHRKVKGVGLWGMQTGPEQFGYKHNTNLRFRTDNHIDVESVIDAVKALPKRKTTPIKNKERLENEPVKKKGKKTTVKTK